jgi:hypothetical protein
MFTVKNGGFLGRLPLFSKLSLFLRRRIVFKCSPESLASFTYPFAKNTGENRSLRLFLASLDSNELERDCLPEMITFAPYEAASAECTTHCTPVGE